MQERENKVCTNQCFFTLSFNLTIHIVGPIYLYNATITLCTHITYNTTHNTIIMEFIMTLFYQIEKPIIS